MAQSNAEAKNVEVHDQSLAPKQPEIAGSGPAVEPVLTSSGEKNEGSSSTQHQLESQQGPQTTDASDKQHAELASAQEVTGESSTNVLQQTIEAEDVSGLELSCICTKLTVRRIQLPGEAETMIRPMEMKCKFDLVERDNTESAKSASYTASLSSSVINFKYENGRRYHAQDDTSKNLPPFPTNKSR